MLGLPLLAAARVSGGVLRDHCRLVDAEKLSLPLSWTQREATRERRRLQPPGALARRTGEPRATSGVTGRVVRKWMNSSNPLLVGPLRLSASADWPAGAAVRYWSWHPCSAAFDAAERRAGAGAPSASGVRGGEGDARPWYHLAVDAAAAPSLPEASASREASGVSGTWQASGRGTRRRWASAISGVRPPTAWRRARAVPNSVQEAGRGVVE